MTKETQNLEKQYQRLTEIEAKFNKNEVGLNDILELVEESSAIEKDILSRINEIEKALIEKIDKEEKA